MEDSVKLAFVTLDLLPNTLLLVEKLKEQLVSPSSERIFLMYEALRKGMSVEELCKMTYIGRWFIQEMKELMDFEEKILTYSWKNLSASDLIKSKPEKCVNSTYKS